MSLLIRRLLPDVHTLASLYHWSLEDILSLPLLRRRAFLGLIEAERDRELLAALD